MWKRQYVILGNIQSRRHLRTSDLKNLRLNQTMCPYLKEKRLASNFCQRIKISLKQRSTASLKIWLWHLLLKIKIMEQWKIGFDIYFIFIQGHRNFYSKPHLQCKAYTDSFSGRHSGLICSPKSLLSYQIPTKKLNLPLNWAKHYLHSVTDTHMTSRYRMEEIILMQ